MILDFFKPWTFNFIIYLSECHLKSLFDFFSFFKMLSVMAFPWREGEMCVSIIQDKV